MTNAEKYKNEIRALKRPELSDYESTTFGVTKSTSELKVCYDMQADKDCIDNCIFYDKHGNTMCAINRMEWLMAEHKPVIKTISPMEKRFCDFLIHVFGMMHAMNENISETIAINGNGSAVFDLFNVYVTKDREVKGKPDTIELWYGKPHLTASGSFSQYDINSVMCAYSLGSISKLDFDGLDFSGIGNEQCYKLVDVALFNTVVK